MICEGCGKYIPLKENYFEEYYYININYNKKQELLYKKMMKMLEKNTNKELCICSNNMELKKERLKKNINLINLKKQGESLNLLEEVMKNNSFVILKSVLVPETQIKFLKEEKELWLLKDKENMIISYEDLKIYLKSLFDKKCSDILYLKNTMKNLIIYDLENIAQIKNYFLDLEIMKLLKARKENVLNTVLIFNNLNLSYDYNNLLNDIIDEDIYKFYKIFSNPFLEVVNIKNNKYYLSKIDNKTILKFNKNNIKPQPKKTSRKTTKKALEEENINMTSDGRAEI